MMPRRSPRRIAQAFAEPFVRSRATQSHLTASIGFSVFPTDTPERDQLLSNAKLAMHRAKSKQRGSICMYEPPDGRWPRAGAARWCATCRPRPGRDELECCIISCRSWLGDGKVCGAEALMRWRHPKRGMISPAEFIPLAEETGGMIGAMGEWALRTACRDAAAGEIPGTVAVNLSPVQFGREDLAETDPRNPAGDRPAAVGASRSRSPNRPSCRTRAAGPAYPAQAQGDGDLGRDGRFRHRLFVAGDAARLSVRQDQARPVIRAATAGRRSRGGDRPHRAGARRQPAACRCSPKASRPRRSGSSWRAKAAPEARVICSPGRWRLPNCRPQSPPRRGLSATMHHRQGSMARPPRRSPPLGWLSGCVQCFQGQRRPLSRANARLIF